MDVFVTAFTTLISLPLKIYQWLCDTFFTLDMSKKGPVFVTGCDTGFGSLLVHKLIKNGINTFAGCYTEQGEIELRKASGKGPGKLWTVRLDVTDQSSVDNALDFVKQELGPGKGLWALVNNAGALGVGGPDDWMTVDDYQRALDVNFLGVVRMTHAFKPLLKKERGRLVIITSIFGRIASPGCGAYCASKFAAEAYADICRLELKLFGVSVHILEPGFFATNLTKPSIIIDGMMNLWQKQSAEVKEEYGEEYIKAAVANLATNLPPLCNKRLDLVVDAYYHALTSSCPSRRYHVGNDAKMFYIPLSTLPTCLQDKIFEILFKINGAPKPKAAI